MFISNNRASFHLRWKESLVKHRKVSKYYAIEFSSIVLVLFRERVLCFFLYFSCFLDLYGDLFFSFVCLVVYHSKSRRIRFLTVFSYLLCGCLPFEYFGFCSKIIFLLKHGLLFACSNLQF